MSGVQGPGGPTSLTAYGGQDGASAPVSLDQAKQIMNLVLNFSESDDWANKAEDLVAQLKGSTNPDVKNLVGSIEDTITAHKSYEGTRYGPDGRPVIGPNPVPLQSTLISLGQLLQYTPSTPIDGSTRFGLFLVMAQGNPGRGESTDAFLKGIQPTTATGREALAQVISCTPQSGDVFDNALANLITTE